MPIEYSTAELFRSLVKDGCKWHGDIISRKWAEELMFDKHASRAVRESCERHGQEGVHWKIGDGAVLIA